MGWPVERIRRKKRSDPTKGFLMDTGHPAEHLIRRTSRVGLCLSVQADIMRESEVAAPRRLAGFRPKKEAARCFREERKEREKT